jgi:hypothetical protein
MKKLFTLVIMAGMYYFGHSQTMGIVGDFSNWGGNPDVTMTTTDGIEWEAKDVSLPIDGGVKFRLDQDWANNWGGASWPIGVAQPGGDNIPSKAGKYNVMFNQQTGEYSFTEIKTDYDEVSLVGGFNGNGDPVRIITFDGINYNATNAFMAAAGVRFKRTAPVETTWGGTQFPSGTAVENAAEIPSTRGYYNVSFNLNTLAYNFETVPVTLIGDGAEGWDTDIEMTSTDGGVTHYLYNYTLQEGDVKFRANNGWATNWGGAGFPMGDVVPGGDNIPVEDGTYEVISFNRFTGKYYFGGDVNDESLSARQNANPILSGLAYPSPATDRLNFSVNAPEFIASITDVTGRTVLTTSAKSIDIQALNSGVYTYVIEAKGMRIYGKFVKN